jgi:hypothetical protein
VVVAATVVVVLRAVVVGADVVAVVDGAAVVEVPKIVEPDESSPHAARKSMRATPTVNFFKEPPISSRNLLAIDRCRGNDGSTQFCREEHSIAIGGIGGEFAPGNSILVQTGLVNRQYHRNSNATAPSGGPEPGMVALSAARKRRSDR